MTREQDFDTINSTSSLNGSKTEQNLRLAFEKESANFARGSIFSSVASSENNAGAERAFDEQAKNDRRLAEMWLSYVDGIGDTAENLEFLARTKESMGEDVYSHFADIATDEGFDEIGEKMRLASNVKRRQVAELREEKERVEDPDSVFSQDPETVWVCTSCGFALRGNTPPERCPLCAYPRDYFDRG